MSPDTSTSPSVSPPISGLVSGLLIDNVWSDGTGTERLTVTSPYSGERIATLLESSPADVDAAIASARKAFEARQLAPYDRYRILRRAAELIDERGEQFARSVVAEAGKPIRDARVEVSRAVLSFELCAEEAKRIGGEYVPINATPGSENRHAFSIRRPAGVVCAITPFNGPVNQLSHKVPTAIAAGATVVLKPAELTPLSAILLVQALLDAGLPPGHVSVVQGRGETVGQQLLEDPRFALYTFTGSTEVGRHIRQTVGLRKTLLELGNNSANIVHADADLTLAARQLARSMSAYAGQVCISAQRLLVHEAVYDEFTRLLTEQVRALRLGDPAEETTDVGPMISEPAARRAESWIQEAVAGGAELLCGGERTGSFVTPTVIANPSATANLVCQEAFAPVVSVLGYRELDRAFELANSTPYGLQAGIFTSSIDVAMAAAERLEVGGVIVNDSSSYRVDSMPYGGVKDSGSGREGVRYAVEEMTEPRLVVLNVQPPRLTTS
jgi:acyl-CoA reductase-like NAD-dependent aldehyde dehydrogenase